MLHVMILIPKLLIFIGLLLILDFASTVNLILASIYLITLFNVIEIVKVASSTLRLTLKLMLVEFHDAWLFSLNCS